LSVKAEVDVKIGKKFRILVEEVFQVSRSAVENLELTEILDPYIFENHRDIVNALFEVYYDLSNQYVSQYQNGN
jgi:ABC-type polysaccharide transport system permease subunit